MDMFPPQGARAMRARGTWTCFRLRVLGRCEHAAAWSYWNGPAERPPVMLSTFAPLSVNSAKQLVRHARQTLRGAQGDTKGNSE